MDQGYLVYGCKMGSFQFTNVKISTWESTGIFNYSGDFNMKAVGDASEDLPEIKNDGRMYVYLSGNHFQQNKVIILNNDNVINIYCVYEIETISSSRDTSFTIQNALFGSIQITKNAIDNSKNDTNGRNVLIFGVEMSFSVHATNRANSIYVMGNGLTQGIHSTTLYVEKNYWRSFTDPGKKFIISLHDDGDESYFFVNGRNELKFKAKTNQLVKEKLCIGNLSDQWIASESEKTGLYGNIYDFLVDYQAIVGVGPIYNMRRYLMTKQNIRP